MEEFIILTNIIKQKEEEIQKLKNIINDNNNNIEELKKEIYKITNNDSYDIITFSLYIIILLLHQPKRKMRQKLLIFIHSKAMFQIIC